VKVLYTRGEEETIKTFVAKMEEVEIDDLTLVTQRGLTKCYVETDQENSS
jgi:ribosomal protein L12E/L44/L45/RPP1/RPP2